MDEINTNAAKERKFLHYLNTLALMILAFIAGIYASQYSGLSTIFNAPPRLPSTNNAQLYTQVWDLLHSDYFDKNVNNDKLFYASIKGMVASLNDPATQFLSPQDNAQFQNISSGNTFAGIGVELGYKDNVVIIERILENTPASGSDLRIGDVLLAVDGKDTSTQQLNDIVTQIQGHTGTQVVLHVKDIASGNTIDVKLTRAPIHVTGMYVKTLTDSSGSKVDELVIARFTEDSIGDWKQEWDASVKTIVQDNPAGVIIDLRDNPGGFFDAAIYALSDLLPNNSLGAIQQNRDGSETSFYTETNPRLSHEKIAILVNGNTASAAEIFSGALQYYKRVTLIGEKTYGKGTAQQVYDFSDGSSLHLTTTHWLLPSGRWIQASSPVVPDDLVQYSTNDFLQGNDPQLAKALSLL